MQAGRELDVKVAEALGYKVLRDKKPWMIESNPMVRNILPSYSTTWGGMGVLVEEAAKKQDIYLKVEADPHGGYEASAWDERDWINYESITAESAPHAVSIAFLEAMRIAI
ncbi:hypothetical protein [Brevibacillus borstelensis]|uniref:hypothetical protein n=1 Tax=Brevibacillus borstelensis TaxID=45462 RepID=UPI0030BB9F7E